MFFTLSSESSICLQIILATMILPIVERSPYLPLLINAVRKSNNSTLLSCSCSLERKYYSTRKVRYLIPKCVSYYNGHSHMIN